MKILCETPNRMFLNKRTEAKEVMAFLAEASQKSGMTPEAILDAVEESMLHQDNLAMIQAIGFATGCNERKRGQ